MSIRGAGLSLEKVVRIGLSLAGHFRSLLETKASPKGGQNWGSSEITDLQETPDFLSWVMKEYY